MNDKENFKIIEQSSDLTLVDLLSVLFLRKFSIISFTIIFSLIGALFSFTLPDVYKSSAVLTSVQASGSGFPSQYSSIASFAGISLPSEGNNKTLEAIERIKSFDFFSNIFLTSINKQDLVAVKNWDKDLDKLVYDTDIYNEEIQEWAYGYNELKTEEPSTQEAYVYYLDILSIIEEDDAFVVITIEHPSPYIAQSWTELIVSKINESMRDYEKQQIINAIDFLNTQIKKASNAEVIKSLSAIQEDQLESLTKK